MKRSINSLSPVSFKHSLKKFGHIFYSFIGYVYRFMKLFLFDVIRITNKKMVYVLKDIGLFIIILISSEVPTPECDNCSFQK